MCEVCVCLCATFWLFAQQRFNLKRHLLLLIRGDCYSSRLFEVEGTAYCFDKKEDKSASQSNLSASHTETEEMNKHEVDE